MLRVAADAGDEHAAETLADLLAARGDLDGLRARLDVGNESVGWRLSYLLLTVSRAAVKRQSGCASSA
jgi:hypothetical protein